MSDTKEENNAPWRHGVGTIYDFKDWARDSDGALSDTFDPELGHPSAYQVLDMIQTWVLFQNTEKPFTVADVAKAFNIQPYRVAECVRLVESPYCFLSSEGDDYTKVTIELDGE